MMCFSPISIKNPSGKSHKDRISVPCGHCYACKTNSRIQWTFRISKELLVSDSAYFVTLTYSDENVPEKVDKKTGEIFKVLRKADLQTFIKALRYYSDLRHFSVGEYGEGGDRPHYHTLLFNLSRKGAMKIHDLWKFGNIHIGQVETASIHYCTKDMMKNVKDNHVFGVKGFRIMSTKPAIGHSFLNHLMNNKINNDFKVFMNGWKTAMPRYYRDKVFNIREKEVHQQEMIELADSSFLDYLEECKKKDVKNPFTYIEQYRAGLLRREKKNLKLRKL